MASSCARRRSITLAAPSAYRVEFAGGSACYVTDTEHVPGEPDAAVLDLIAGADLVIYDATYTDEEFERLPGLGPLDLAGGHPPVRGGGCRGSWWPSTTTPSTTTRRST